FYRVTRGNSGDGVSGRKAAGYRLLVGLELVQNALSISVLTGLQIGIFQVIHRMQRLVPHNAWTERLRGVILSRFGGNAIGGNRVLTLADSCEDMRGHVQRMRDCRRDA